jgi:hypothetical protein
MPRGEEIKNKTIHTSIMAPPKPNQLVFEMQHSFEPILEPILLRKSCTQAAADRFVSELGWRIVAIRELDGAYLEWE